MNSKWKIIFTGMLLVAATGSNAFAAEGSTRPTTNAVGVESGKTLYTCGMHPWIIRDRPGNCPICGMKLEPVRKQADDAATVGQGNNFVLPIHHESERDQPHSGQGQHGHGHGAGL